MENENSNNKINDLMTSAIKNINSIIDVNTVVGNPITQEDGCVIIPLAKVTMAFLTGGGEYGQVKKLDTKNTIPFAGGSGAIVSLKPQGFLVRNGESVKLLGGNDDVYSKAFNTIDDFIKTFKNNDKI